ncbi:d-amino-acid transaminase chloroplastic [Phtheirospermum japonicum]|uniref:D-amino-acid transaminase chloroplastic n=1 Tax=Phtheirospermum japonicum TaxID=374723 RepID=A0A830D2L3_9LAMI|nr:d-amino-acid transaminase chloroplastic [Phtheirospermum japonicum]
MEREGGEIVVVIVLFAFRVQGLYYSDEESEVENGEEFKVAVFSSSSEIKGQNSYTPYWGLHLKERLGKPKPYPAMYSSVFGGIILDPAMMLIPIDDHMVRRGHGVFDTIIDGYIYELDAHLARFLKSASKAKILSPFSEPDLQNILIQLTIASQCKTLGEALSTRPDILPKVYCNELAKLQDQIPPFPTPVAIKSIESQLGMPVSEIFADISKESIAAASLGQLYKVDSFVFSRALDGCAKLLLQGKSGFVSRLRLDQVLSSVLWKRPGCLEALGQIWIQA